MEIVPVKHEQQTKTVPESVLSTLLYGSECWRMTECDLNKLSTFHTKNLRRILLFSGLRPSTTNNVSPTVTKRAWGPSSCEGLGDG